MLLLEIFSVWDLNSRYSRFRDISRVSTSLQLVVYTLIIYLANHPGLVQNSLSPVSSELVSSCFEAQLTLHFAIVYTAY